MSIDETRVAVTALVRAAPPSLDWDRVAAGARDLLVPLLRTVPDLPGDLLDAVVRSGDGTLLEALARNDSAMSDAHLASRLADTGRPEVAKGAKFRYDVHFWRRLLAAAPPEAHPRDYIDVRDISVQIRDRMAAALAFAPFPGLYGWALASPGHPLTRWERLAAFHRMHVAEGPDAVRTRLKDERPEFAAPVLAALDAGEDLSGLLAEAMSPEAVIEVLYDETDPHRDAYLKRLPELDWDHLLDAHARRPFDDAVAAGLVSRRDAPDAAVLALARTHPETVLANARRVTEDLWDVLPGTARPAKALVGRLRETGRTGSLLDRARPAVAVLSSLGPDDVVRGKLRELVASTLGEDVDAWRTVRGLVGSFKGTVTALLEETAARVATGRARSGDWPGAADLPGFGKKAAPTGARAAFLTLLDAAPAGTQLALLSMVDDRTAHDLLVHGEWHPEWLDHVLAKGTREQRIALASRTSLPTRETQRLVDLGDPLVDARLFARTNTSTEQRQEILGRPLDPEFRAWLLTRTAGWRGRDAVGCADLEVQRHILAHSRVRGMVPQTRMLLNVWERHGAGAVRDYLDGDLGPGRYDREPFFKPTVKKVRALLDAGDDEAGKAELRRYLAERESGAWQVARLRKLSEYTSFNEDHAWRWDELLAAHRESPLPEWAVAGLNTEPSCPAGLRREDGVRLEVRFLRDGKWSVEEFIADLMTSDHLPRTTAALAEAEAEGLLTRDLVLERGRPAVKAVAATHAGSGTVTGLPALAAELGVNAEAWVLALRVLPDFHGTLRELLRTAALTV